jgi:Superinfection immunity protein
MGNVNGMYQPRTSTTLMVIAWIAAVVSGLYMLPWAVAVTRGKSNATAIGFINLLLGWTIVGWVVALVMACRPHKDLAAYR